jgi:hypothetical protein
MDIEKQLARFIDPRATNRARVENTATKLLSRLGADPRRVGGMLFNQALGQMPQIQEYGRKALGITTPEERVNAQFSGLQGMMSESERLNQLPAILRAQNMPMRGALLQQALDEQELARRATEASIAQANAAAGLSSARAGALDLEASQHLAKADLAARLSTNNDFVNYLYKNNDSSSTEGHSFANLSDDVLDGLIERGLPDIDSFTPMSYTTKEGNRETVFVNDRGEFMDRNGQMLSGEDIPDFVVTASLSAVNAADLGVSKDAMEELITMGVSANQVIDLGAQIYQLADAQQATTFVSQLANWYNGVQAELSTAMPDLMSLANANPTLDMETVIDTANEELDIFEKNNKSFDQLGFSRGVMESMVIELAYIAARAEQNGNSISNYDIQSKIRQIGFNQSDGRIMKANVKRMVETAVSKYKDTFQQTTNKEATNLPENWRDRFISDAEKAAASIGLP